MSPAAGWCALLPRQAYFCATRRARDQDCPVPAHAGDGHGPSYTWRTRCSGRPEAQRAECNGHHSSIPAASTILLAANAARCANRVMSIILLLTCGALREPLLVIGIIGRNDAQRRSALRLTWVRAGPAIVARFAVSAAEPPIPYHEPDIDLVNATGGSLVGAFATFHAWLQLVCRTRTSPSFFGRADDDIVVSLSWLEHLVRSLGQHPIQPHMVAGHFEWYHWDTINHRPHANGADAWSAHISAKRVPACRIRGRCSGPFPFAKGPLVVFSAPLARWYAGSAAVYAAASRAISSRLHLKASKKINERSLSAKLFDDVFFGHQVCMGPREAVDSSSESGGGGSGGGGGDGLSHLALVDWGHWPSGAAVDRYGDNNRSGRWNEKGPDAAALCPRCAAAKGLWQRAAKCFCGVHTCAGRRDAAAASPAAWADSAVLTPPLVHNVKSRDALAGVWNSVSSSQAEWHLGRCGTMDVWRRGTHRFAGCGHEWTYCSHTSACARDHAISRAST